MLICHGERENVLLHVLKDCYITNSSLDRKKQKKNKQRTTKRTELVIISVIYLEAGGDTSEKIPCELKCICYKGSSSERSMDYYCQSFARMSSKIEL